MSVVETPNEPQVDTIINTKNTTNKVVLLDKYFQSHAHVKHNLSENATSLVVEI